MDRVRITKLFILKEINLIKNRVFTKFIFPNSAVFRCKNKQKRGQNKKIIHIKLLIINELAGVRKIGN